MKRVKRLIGMTCLLAAILGCLLLHVSAAEVVASGYCGGGGDGTHIAWTLTDDGVLTLTGKGPMNHCYEWPAPTDMPWYEWRSEITAVEIGEGITTIGASMFEDCAMESISLPSTLRVIYRHAFSHCRYLREIEFPESLQEIEQYAFIWCNIEQVHIPANVTKIEEGVFANCHALTEFTVDEGNQTYMAKDGVLFEIDEKTLTAYPAGNPRISYAIPNTVTKVFARAFDGCDFLEDVQIPDSVTTLENGAFMDCGSLTDVDLPDSITTLEGYVFNGCIRLGRIEIPDGITVIKNGTFEWCGLDEIVLPEGLTTIEPYAFHNCMLTEVTIPATVTSIGSNGFIICESLTDVYFLGDAPAVVAAGERGATFDVERVLLHYVPGTRGWTDSSAYDPIAKTWNGYRLAVEERENDFGILLPGIDDGFADVTEEDYFFAPVEWAVDKGITDGTSATAFSPEMACTRGQAVAFLWRAAGCPVTYGEMPFTDVPAEAYYYDAVLWAVENGIAEGTSATTFSPDQSCTRGQIVTFLWRWAGRPAATGAAFADVAVGSYCYDAVRWAVEYGITNGLNEHTFAPDKICTRAQIVTFLYRYMA